MAATDPRSEPWYRQRWPWILMSGPALVVIAGFITLYLAVRSEDGLVVDDYYKEGLAINVTLAREDRARSLGLTAVLDFTGRRDGVRLKLRGRVAKLSSLQLRLVHPTRAGYDQRVVLSVGPDGTYTGVFKPLGPGIWDIVLEDAAATWKLAGSLSPEQGHLVLQPPAG